MAVAVKEIFFRLAVLRQAQGLALHIFGLAVAAEIVPDGIQVLVAALPLRVGGGGPAVLGPGTIFIQVIGVAAVV